MCQKTFHVEPLILLHELEVNFVARGETLQVFAPIPAGLILEVLGLNEIELALLFEDAGIESVKEIAVAPFPGKTLGLRDTVYHHLEGDVGKGLDLDDFLLDDFVGAVVRNFHVEPVEPIIVALPNGGEM